MLLYKLFSLNKLIVIIAFAIITFQLVYGQNLDYRILHSVNIDRNVNLDPAFKFISKTATPVSVGVPLTILSIGGLKSDKARLKLALNSGIAISSAMLISTVLKFTFDRQRPYQKYPDIQPLSRDFTPSFPSGHTTSAFCTATTLSLMYRKWYIIIPSFTWASLVGYSRMHMGMHYLTDVLGGMIIGIGTSYLTYRLLNK